MARNGDLVIHVVPGVERTGIWCDRCLSCAAIEFDIYGLSDSGPWLMKPDVRWCQRCDGDGEA